MTRERAINFLVFALLVALGVWVARNTYWEDISVPVPPRGEAADNPFYGLERLAAVLGVQTREIASLPPLPPQDAVLLVGLGPQPALSSERLPAIERWVEAGGRLAVPSELMRANKELQAWTKISPIPLPEAPKAARGATNNRQPRGNATAFMGLAGCKDLVVASDGTPTGATLQICGLWIGQGFESLKSPAWSLGDLNGLYSLRIPMGKGSVSVIAPAMLYQTQFVVKSDHAKIFFAVTDLSRGDQLWIHRPAHAEPLLAMLWRLAAPAILCAGLAIALWIWRNLPRFGPPVPAAAAARRSLAEQLRANASFSWRTRSLGALYTAARRGLEETARREIVAYERMPGTARIGAIAARSGISGDALTSAFASSAGDGADAQRAAITALEQARRLLKPGPSPLTKV
jgi:hypothetical protein